MLRRLLLVPLLAPLVAVLLVGALNPRPAHSLRLLVWSSPALPIGVWIALAGAGGAALSAGATALALRPGGPALRRQARQQSERPGGGDRVPPERGTRQPPPAATPAAGWSWPKRSPQDPPPTVSVPFRVIRKGTAAPAPARTPARTPARSAPAAATATAGESAADESWDRPDQDDW